MNNQRAACWRRSFQGLLLSPLFFSAWAIWASASFGAGNLQCDYWQTGDGVPNHDVVSIAQTTEGFIFLGTTGSTNSLVYFDGVDFIHPFFVPNGDDHHHTQVAAGREGRLWASKSSSSNSLMCWQNGQMTNYNLALPPAGIRGMPLFEDGRGGLWVGGGGLLVRSLSGQVQRFEAFAKEFGEVRQVTESKDGVIWLATSQGLVRYCQDRFERPYPINIGLCSVYASKDGSLWLGTDSKPGLIQITPKGKIVPYSTADGLESRGVCSICEDREGNLWLGSYSGLYCVRDGKVYPIQETELMTSFIFSLMWDREDSLWVGTADGLYRLHKNPIKQYGAVDGLGPVSSLAIGPSGPWANVFSRGVFLLENNIWKKRLEIPDQSKDCRLLETANGDIWLATETSCYHFHDGKTDVLQAVGGMAVFCSDGEKTWIANSTNLFCFSNGKLAQLGEKWPMMGITCVVTNRTGGLLIGTSRGLFEWSGKLTQLLGFGKDLPGACVKAIEWEGETLWVASDKAIAWRKGQWGTINIENVLPGGDSINSMLVDKEGLWLGSANGLFQITRSEADQCLEGRLPQITLVGYGKSQGLRSSYLGASVFWGQGAARGNDGKLWFASKNGVVVVDMKEGTSPKPSPVVIERVLLDQRPVVDFRDTPDHLIRVPADARNVEIHYAALTYIEAGKAIYKYRLVGLDSDWASVGYSRVARFSKLPPGNYEFQVQGCNAAGVWNEQGSRIRFIKEPFFHQTLAFFVISVVLGIAVMLVVAGSITAVAHMISTRRMRRRMQLLEFQQALDHERARIARDIHDDVGSTLTRIAFLTELASRQPEQAFTPDGHLAGIRHAAREITRRLDEIVWAVNPRNDTLDALVSYISKLAMDQAQVAGLRCRLKVPAILPAWPVNGSIRHNVFLACKEAIHNAIKHASASELQFRLTVQEESFLMEICDNGVGLSAGAHEKGGDGLINLRERLTTLGGTCAISSIAGQGTTVKFHVPGPKTDPSLSPK